MPEWEPSTPKPVDPKTVKTPITDALRNRLNPDKFADALLEASYNGDVSAAKLVMQYVDGPPAQEKQEKEVIQTVIVLPSNGR